MNKIGICIIIGCVLLIAAILLCIFKYRYDCSIVNVNSEKIKKLFFLNEQPNFIELQTYYPNCITCNTKRQFDMFSPEEYLVSLIDSNEDKCTNIVKYIEHNKLAYKDYLDKVSEIKSTADEKFCKAIGLSFNKFFKYETKIFKNNILESPEVDIKVHCKIIYSSPQGRNVYCKERQFNYEQFKYLYDNVLEMKEQRNIYQFFVKHERAKMTDSLRYDILKRDNFRCQICGASASDGVKLHVDHIIPVSKGGLTEISNLRTLCDRCNLGKSDKM